MRTYKPKSQTSHCTVLSASARKLHWVHPYINELQSIHTLLSKTCELAQIETVAVVVVVVVVEVVTAILIKEGAESSIVVLFSYKGSSLKEFIGLT